MMEWAAAWIAGRTLFLLWLFLLYVLSLPQAVVLWTEPQGPARSWRWCRPGCGRGAQEVR